MSRATTLILIGLAGASAVAFAGACAQVWGFEEPLDPSALLGDGGVAEGQAPGCTNETVDPDKGIFVIGGAADGGTNVGTDNATCGDKDSPCATIGVALQQVAHITGKSIVYVVRGVYTESITVPAGVTLEGGWNALRIGTEITYAKACSDAPGTAVVIQAPSTATTTVLVSDSSQPVTLQDLQIRTKATANASESLYAVRISAPSGTPNVTLIDVNAIAANGGDGSSGAAGVPGNPGDAGGCTPATDPDAIDGSVPPVADAGAPGSSSDGGELTADGIGATNGSDGQPGAFGANGITPTPPAPITCDTACGGIPCAATTTSKGMGSTGNSGCGGYPGGPGKGGGGGGSSIALYAWNAVVTIVRGSFTTGNGGAGGGGGEGASGGAGTTGLTGDAGASCTTACGAGTLSLCTTITPENPPGGAGTQGGAGGAGGAGGLGAGGDAIAIVAAGASKVMLDSATALKIGSAGSAPAGGASGVAQATVGSVTVSAVTDP